MSGQYRPLQSLGPSSSRRHIELLLFDVLQDKHGASADLRATKYATPGNVSAHQTRVEVPRRYIMRRASQQAC